MPAALRSVAPGDAAEVTALLDAPEHPATVEKVRARLERIITRDRTGALVADTAGTAVALVA